MTKTVHFASSPRARVLLCGCAAVLLGACGGNGGDAGAAGPAGRTAAEVLDSKTLTAANFDPRNPAVAEAAAAAAIAGTGADETAGPAAGIATPESEASAEAPQAAGTSAVPEVSIVPAPGLLPAPAGTARIYVAGPGPSAVL